MLYTGLANHLNPHFSCYGVDNYNFYNDDKIFDLNKLAKIYLDQIMPIIISSNQTTFYLLGVCLGGVIAASMAIQL